MPTIRDRSVVTSSVMPSTKYWWSGSLPRLAKGSTAIDRRGRAPPDQGEYQIPAARMAIRTRAPMTEPTILAGNRRHGGDMGARGTGPSVPGAPGSNGPVLAIASSLLLPVLDTGEVSGSTRVTGATNRYPRPGTV